MQKTGDPGPPGLLRRQAGEGCVTPEGYLRITTPDGRTMHEHRYIVEMEIGRELTKQETVHHKNGIRKDNRIENLELWVKGHPYGQRPEDLIAFVWKMYPEAVLAMTRGEPLTLSLF